MAIGEPYFEDGPGAVLGWLAAEAPYGLELGAYYRRPLTTEAEPVGARLQTLAFRLLVSFDVWRGAPSVLRIAAGAGADFVRVSPEASAESDVELAPSDWLSLVIGRATVSYSHDLGRLVDLELTLGLDVDPLATHYLFASSAGEQEVLNPWPVRPLLSVGATVP